MSISESIKTILEADSNLTTILTGGIFTFDETGYMGVTVTTTPSAFTGPVLKPCAVVKARNKVAGFSIIDEKEQVTDFEQVIEIWLMQANSTETIEQAEGLVYTLLHNKRIINNMPIRWMRTSEGDEMPDMAGAMFILTEFRLYGLKGVS